MAYGCEAAAHVQGFGSKAVAVVVTRLVNFLPPVLAIGLGVCETVIYLENMHSEFVLRKCKREGREFIADEFGKRE